jgi:hypothetical protein
VTIRLGPTDDTLSQGFLCVGDISGEELIRSANIGDGKLRFAVVVDIIGLGSKVPGCRGEELITACSGGQCTLEHRACRIVTIDIDPMMDRGPEILAKLRAELADFQVIDNAPDEPVLIRVMSVKGECPSLVDNVASTALGCAYSCPTRLDDVDEVFVSLDTLTNQCENAVRICAGL